MNYETLILIGANGFIGRALSKGLSGRMRVLGFDLPEVNIADPVSLDRLQSRLRNAVGQPSSAIVVNAAGLMDATQSRQMPDLYYRVNGTAVGNVLHLCDSFGVGGFIQLSSETVYGRGDEAFAEDGPRIPLHPYGIGKLIAELTIQDHAAAYPCAVLRLPVVVGLRQALDNPISLFCKEAKAQGRITLLNGGKHRRKFVAVDDVVGQIAAMLDQGLAPGTETYNVGGVSAAMIEVANKIAVKVPGVTLADKPSTNQAFTLLSTSDKIARFGYVPRVDLDAMIDAFLALA